MWYRSRSWVLVLAVLTGLLLLPYFGMAEPDQQTPPSPPVTVDQQGKPLPAPTPTSDLPPNGRVDPPSVTTADPQGHSRWSTSASGTTMPMTVEEMKAHGYLGIPGPEQARPGVVSTPVAQSAGDSAESDVASDAAELADPGVSPGPDAGVDLGPSVPENLNRP